MVLSKDLKIAICFGLIMGAILSLCNMCFASEIETLSPSIYNGLVINDTKNTLVGNPNYDLYYVELEPGYTYYFNNNGSSSIYVCYGDEIVSGAPITIVTCAGGSSIDFVGSSGFVFYGTTSGSFPSYISFTREKLEGLPNFVDNIVYSLSIGQLSSVWVLVVPILSISVLFGLGFYLLKRLSNKIKRSKGGV